MDILTHALFILMAFLGVGGFLSGVGAAIVERDGLIGFIALVPLTIAWASVTWYGGYLGLW
ncbi:hypothetical protein ACDN41_12460 [Priestia aryabhattai]|uniref:hypothetical protein n=1 Tax=Priestia aryabhattai TaxID=412384 RepID=UPI0035321E71